MVKNNSVVFETPFDFARRLPALMFCVGLYAMLSQILLLREMLVAFDGNELTIGAMLSVWLVVVGLGSMAVRRLLPRVPAAALQWGIAGALIVLTAALPAQVWVIRVIRAVLGVPYGEAVPFDAMLLGTALLLLPTCLGIGCLFPCACHLAQASAGGIGDARAIGRLYAVESLGSMLGGALFTFVFAQWLTPFAIMAVAGLAAVGGAALAAPGTLLRRVLWLPALALLVAAVCPRCLAGLEWKSIEARWRAFGALPPAEAGLAAARLEASVDSRYQNLALIEAQGQLTLYGDGKVLMVFPDPITGEHKIHFIMAQNPKAASVLLIGGNPATDVPELLKYPLQRLVRVEPDGEISRLLDLRGGREYARAAQDPRYRQVAADGPRFLKTTRATFDVIIVDAPAPTTIALNRLYTLEFYQAAGRRLAAGGFLCTSLEASELLQGDAADLAASVARSLKRAFPEVLISGGTRNWYFAGNPDSQLTFDGETLFQRSAAAGLRCRYFRPEYFLNDDDISPEKLAFVERRLAEIRVPANTVLRPVAAHYHLVLWSHFSGSRLEGLLAGLGRLRFDATCGGIGLAGLTLLLAGAGLALRRRASRGDNPSRWARAMLALLMAITGFCGITLELILVYVFQGLLGYVYARIGLIVAVFMLGLMLGAWSAAAPAPAPAGTWRIVLGLNAILMGLAVAIPILANACLQSAAPVGSGLAIEFAIDAMILLAGWAVGAQFIAVNRLLHALGLAQGSAAALANAADLFGAAVGGFAVGVLLLPLWGIQPACLLLAAVNGAGVLIWLSARVTGGREIG